jgi:hypothetical protein
MCLDLLYRNSSSEYMVDFSYLAVKDKILVNKVYESEDEIKYSGNFENYLWMRLENSKGEPVLTTLINYDDIECDFKDKETFWKTLQGQLTHLSNEEYGDELVYNCAEMLYDTLLVSGFTDTYIGKLIDEALNETQRYYIRTVDFGMHLPSELEIHPFYDT